MPGPSDQLRGELRAQGVDASQIDWVVMDSICGIYRQDAAAYSGCLRQKALDYMQYRRDAESCRELERQVQRQGMPFTPYIGLHAPPKFSNQAARHEYYRRFHRILQYDSLEAGIVTHHRFETCMEERRWIDSHNWKAGRTED